MATKIENSYCAGLRKALLVAAFLVAAPSPGRSEAAPDMPRLLLFSAGSTVELGDSDSQELVPALTALLESCHSHAGVGGQETPQDDLKNLWRELTGQPHLVLRATGAPASHHPSLRNARFALLLGLPAAGDLSPVLTQSEGGAIVPYTKCPGLEALRLSCRVRSILAGAPAVPDCLRLREIESTLQATPTSTEIR